MTVSIRLHEDGITVSYKMERNHGRAHCISEAPVEHASAISDDDNGAFLDTVDGTVIGRLQCSDLQIRAVLDDLENKGSEVPQRLS